MLIIHTPALKWIGVAFLLLIISDLKGQSDSVPYFQQEVKYTINVTLDDQRHRLTGDWVLDYTNHSPDTLSFIYLHVWANAYSHKQTAFAQQLLDQGRLDFHFAPRQALGVMSFWDEDAKTLSNVRVDGQVAEYTSSDEHVDIVKINLPKPLLPGSSMTLSTPFVLVIPADFSRLARVDQAYYLCQWYPKPAVYDRQGWHPMPYLDYGEYYSEFGSYDVTITLPQNYVVGATGVLQTPSEQAFMDSLAKAHQQLDWEEEALQDDTLPRSHSQKTIRYTAERVHDFAWFASKRFYVQQQQISLPSGKTVNNHILFTKKGMDLWADSALVYARRALLFYSDIVGEYPYPSLTVVEADYKGSDMEYPMVTAVRSGFHPLILENTIVHEIGHNWFYGILGSNEREYPWMDEGMNTYLDERYMRQYQPQYRTGDQESYHIAASLGRDQPIATPSDSLTENNYYICAYAKPALAFSYLEQYLGREELDQILKNYYQQWQFKHPQPEDLRQAFKQGSSKPVDWFFDQLIPTQARLDYATTRHQCCDKHQQASIRIKNKGDVTAPVLVSALTETDSVLAEQWVEGLAVGADTSISMPEADHYHIDLAERMPEYNRNDNVVRSEGLFKAGKPLQARVLFDYFGLDRHKLWLLPLVGYNHYDGLLIGLGAYSSPIPRRPWQYAVAPMFTTGTLTAVGIADLRRHGRLGGHQWMVGLRFKTFNKRRHDYTAERPYRYAERYYKPSIIGRWDWARAAVSPHRHRTGWHSALIGEEQAQISRADTATFGYNGKLTQWRSVHRLCHEYQYKRLPVPLRVKGVLEYAHYERFAQVEQYLKLTLEAKAQFWYSPQWRIDARGFMGGFLWHTDRRFGAFPLVMAAGNRKDFHYDHLLLGRREQDNILAQQVVLADGGFKVPLEEVQFLGATNNFLLSLNLTADIPIRFPVQLDWLKLRPFGDVGYYLPSDPLSQGQTAEESIWVSAGFVLELGDGLANLYVPLLETSNLSRSIQSFTQGQWWRRLTFSLHFNELYKVETVEKWLY